MPWGIREWLGYNSVYSENVLGLLEGSCRGGVLSKLKGKCVSKRRTGLYRDTEGEGSKGGDEGRNEDGRACEQRWNTGCDQRLVATRVADFARAGICSASVPSRQQTRFPS